MLLKLCFVLLITSLVVVQGSIWKSFQDADDLKQIMNILAKPRAPGRYVQEQNEVDAVDGFSWDSCGSGSDLASVKSLYLGPDPVVLPGNISLAVDATLSKNLASPISLNLNIKKKVFIWVEMPCFENIGSCTYDDVCSILAKWDCPPVLIQHGIPCHCPVKAGHYSLPTSPLVIPPIALPSFLKDGDYKIKATLSMTNQQILCLEFTLSIQAGKLVY